MACRNLTLLTDLYELTMMQGYFKEKEANETVIFDAFYRNNPNNNGYSICAGLEQVIEYIKNLHFDEEDVAYLRSTGLFGEDFLEYLRQFHFFVAHNKITPAHRYITPIIGAIISMQNHKKILRWGACLKRNSRPVSLIRMWCKEPY